MISYYLKEIYRDQPISNDVVCSIHKVLIRWGLGSSRAPPEHMPMHVRPVW
jgi:hypothetical protein